MEGDEDGSIGNACITRIELAIITVGVVVTAERNEVKTANLPWNSAIW